MSSSPLVITVCALISRVCYRLGNNLAGHYKRGVGMAMHIGIGNFGGAIASNIYRTQDAPRYILGRECFSIDLSSCVECER